MRVLLDTHSLYWACFEPGKLGEKARACLVAEETVACVSHASLWEMTIKRGLGKLKFPGGFLKALPEHGYQLLPISVAHIEQYGSLPLLHRDPFDRMLIAQAKIEQMALMTRDSDICRYDVELFPA